jgi:hypothetical protein
MVPGPLHCCCPCRVQSCFSPFALHRAALVRGPGQVVPPEGNLHWPPAVAALSGERAKSPKQIENMNTTNQNNNVTAAPSVSIVPRNPARGVLNFVVTLTTHKDVRSYPCRSLESAIKLAERFIAGVTKPRPPCLRWPVRPGPLNHQPSALNPGSGGLSQTSPAPVGDSFCSRPPAPPHPPAAPENLKLHHPAPLIQPANRRLDIAPPPPRFAIPDRCHKPTRVESRFCPKHLGASGH